MAKTNPDIKPKLARFREGAVILGCSETQIRKYVRSGRLRAVELPDTRAKRLVVDEVEALAAQLAGAQR